MSFNVMGWAKKSQFVEDVKLSKISKPSGFAESFASASTITDENKLNRVSKNERLLKSIRSFLSKIKKASTVKAKTIIKEGLSFSELRKHQKPTNGRDPKDLPYKFGGVNKSVNKEYGYLRAKTKVGEKDFITEKDLYEYSTQKGREALAEITSLQRPVEGSSGYAQFDVYDTDIVKSNELDDYLRENSDSINIEDKKRLAEELINHLETMYTHKVSHGDLHMNNIIIRQIKFKECMQFIDFGKAKFGDEGTFEKHKFDDIKYLFCKVGETPRETKARNYLLPAFSPLLSSLEKKRTKHYPLHKLIKLNSSTKSVAPYLEQIGNTLIKDLGDQTKDVKQSFSIAQKAVLRLIAVVDLNG
ncbi:hypothetical protein ACN3E9_07880 [Vibrio pectenicida]|uniref:hypothetical protein n=1 Tax=Vibrio pectenicida TaxID=62763 RepID=UPI003B997918